MDWGNYMLNNLDFSYSSYRLLLQTFLTHGYEPRLIGETTTENEKVLYLRHDVDVDYLGVLPLAKIEHSLGIKSTWYFLPDCPIYNLCSSELKNILSTLHEQDHQIGLHVDATLYSNLEQMIETINVQYDFFSSFLPISRTLSFHRPASWLLDDVKIAGWTNAYQKEFFADVVYVSDSNRREFWKEDRLQIALKGDKALTVLTHPLWWKNSHSTEEAIAHYAKNNLGEASVTKLLEETCRIYKKNE